MRPRPATGSSGIAVRGLKRPLEAPGPGGAFSAAAFGVAVCKRFKAAREALRVGILEGAEQGGQVAETAAIAEAARCRVRAVAADRDEESCSRRRAESLPPRLLPSATDSRLLAARGSGLPPAAMAAELLRPLPPPPGEETVPMRLRCGERLLWQVPLQRRGLDAGWDGSGTQSSRSRSSLREPLGYLEYQKWLQRAVPGVEIRGAEAEDDEADESLQGLSGLELLRKLFPPKAPPRRLTKLTEEERQLADECLYGAGRPDEVLASRFSVELTRGQMQCLLPRTWLNDEVINFYFKLLQERCNKATQGPKCWFTNSFFWNKLSGGPAKQNDEYNYKEVRRWTIKAKVDIFALDFVIFPMNVGEMHWALGAIDLRHKGFRYFDSFISRPHPNFVPYLRRYLADEHKSKKSSSLEGLEDWPLLGIDNLPQQKNCYDCGVFTCFFADRFSSGRPMDFTQDDMPDLRTRLTARVAKADESWENA